MHATTTIPVIFVGWCSLLTEQDSEKCVPVTALQGMYDTIRKQYTLFDPAIHCSCDEERFTGTNLGRRGMDIFFLTHRCNPLCKKLGLRRHASQP
jgi:hypothetical protein